VFVPRREHARFCSGRCRAAWNRERTGDPSVRLSALRWSVTAMGDAMERLAAVRVWGRAEAFTVITDAVWSVTMVDAALVRYRPGAYDRTMAGHTPAERRSIEETMAGLRFVRNRIGHDADPGQFIDPGATDAGTVPGRITGWTWKCVREPGLTSLPSRAHAWEIARYRGYQAQLAGRTVGETFGRAAAFVRLTAANARSITDISADTAP
jgi:hypothetical protein